jgi:hypothetical protein
MKKIFFILITIAVLISGVFYYNKLNTGYKVVNNKLHHFSFKYPSSWKIIGSGKTIEQSSFVSVIGNNISFTITQYDNTKGYTPKQWYERDTIEKLGPNNYPYPEKLVASTQNTILNGYNAYKVVTNDAGASYDYFLLKGNEIYVINIERNDTVDYSKNQRYIDDILNSLSWN